MQRSTCEGSGLSGRRDSQPSIRTSRVLIVAESFITCVWTSITFGAGNCFNLDVLGLGIVMQKCFARSQSVILSVRTVIESAHGNGGRNETPSSTEHDLEAAAAQAATLQESVPALVAVPSATCLCTVDSLGRVSVIGEDHHDRSRGYSVHLDATTHHSRSSSRNVEA